MTLSCEIYADLPKWKHDLYRETEELFEEAQREIKLWGSSGSYRIPHSSNKAIRIRELLERFRVSLKRHLHAQKLRMFFSRLYWRRPWVGSDATT